jgi:hypothetical protein
MDAAANAERIAARQSTASISTPPTAAPAAKPAISEVIGQV